jgi:hypothetical protein
VQLDVEDVLQVLAERARDGAPPVRPILVAKGRNGDDRVLGRELVIGISPGDDDDLVPLPKLREEAQRPRRVPASVAEDSIDDADRAPPSTLPKLVFGNVRSGSICVTFRRRNGPM